MAGKLKLDRVVRVSCGVCEKGVSRWLRGRREGKVRILKRILEDQGVCRLQHPTGAQQETHHRERQKERGLTKRATWQTIERMEERRRRAQTRTKEDDGLGKKRFRLRRVFFYTWLNQTRPNIGDRAGLKRSTAKTETETRTVHPRSILELVLLTLALILDLLMHNTSPDDSLAHRLRSISSFLSRPLVSTLFAFHPNDLGQSLFLPPPEWHEWWDWPRDLCNGHQPEGTGQEEPWLLLLRYYNSCLSGHESSDLASLLPPILRSLISDASKLALPREVGRLYPNHRSTSKFQRHPHQSDTNHLPGMSPKKAHEVAHLVTHLGALISPGSPLCGIQHVVDIGAGQVRRFTQDLNFKLESDPHFCFHRDTCPGSYAINCISMSLP